MASAAITSNGFHSTFEDFEKQTALMKNCTLLWKELSDHFNSLEQDLKKKAETLKVKFETLEHKTKETLGDLEKREVSIDGNVEIALVKVDECREAAIVAFQSESDGDSNGASEEDKVLSKLRTFCSKMDSEGFWEFVVSRKKDLEMIRPLISSALMVCIDPAKFALEAISRIFPVDKRVSKTDRANDLGWACVLILECLVPVFADPVFGISRPLVTPRAKDQAKEMAGGWKENMDQHGGIESVKLPDAHTFLQHTVTFGIVSKEDRELYLKLIVSFAWRKQMPKLAISLGLGDKMADIIEELISKGRQLDAVNFAYEAGLVDKFPPVPLLKSYLNDSKKAATSILEDGNNSSNATHLAGRKEQSALRAIIKCIEERKLEAEFPLESLRKRLEQLEKAKVEKKKPATAPANKRTRANSGGPMPPAKAGRLTNAYVSSFPAGSTFVRSPSNPAPQYPAGVHSYAYDRPVVPSVYGSRSPPSIRDPYAYPPEEVVPAPLNGPYPGAPMNYPAYGGYGNGLVPTYQQAYYR